MIIMPIKEGENIERALKKFKRKYERTGVLKELRRRQYFTKPSVVKREQKIHAIYVEQLHRKLFVPYGTKAGGGNGNEDGATGFPPPRFVSPT